MMDFNSNEYDFRFECRQNCSAYQQGRLDAIEEYRELILQFDDYCDAMECSDCWMYKDDESCLKQWVDRKLEQLKSQDT